MDKQQDRRGGQESDAVPDEVGFGLGADCSQYGTGGPTCVLTLAQSGKVCSAAFCAPCVEHVLQNVARFAALCDRKNHWHLSGSMSQGAHGRPGIRTRHPKGLCPAPLLETHTKSSIPTARGRSSLHLLGAEWRGGFHHLCAIEPSHISTDINKALNAQTDTPACVR